MAVIGRREDFDESSKLIKVSENLLSFEFSIEKDASYLNERQFLILSLSSIMSMYRYRLSYHILCHF